ncbi:R3HC1 protein, partial [Crypturellus undulatus]|nr:R3HC1 protein [Crypturellus undulatus]
PAAALALRGPGGPSLSPAEDDFVGRIAAELELFALRGQQRRVLLFPPLSSRLRYLIHRTVEDAAALSSFSVGEGWRRRTVICHAAVRYRANASPFSCLGFPQKHRVPLASAEDRGSFPCGPGDASRACVGSGRLRWPPRRKPDKALYVPKAMRRRAERPWGPRQERGPGAPGEAGEGDAEGDAAAGDGSLDLSKEQDPGEAAEEPVLENGDGSAQRPASCTDAAVPAGGTDIPEQEDPRTDCAEALNSSHAESPSGAEEEPKSRDDPLELEEAHEGLADALWRELRVSASDAGEDSAAAREQEDGLEDEDCSPELLEEIAAHLTVKDISVEKISFDYCSYGEAQLSESDFSHVVEIHDFSPSLKTEHLMEIFSDFHESGFKIQWVDDTHALGIFCSVTAACQALGRRYPSLKIRPLIHATRQSKTKALQRPKLLQLAKERPQTDTAVARRLVTRALGLKHRRQRGPAPAPDSAEMEE